MKQGQKISPDAILNSFLQAVGSSGTLLLPLFNFDFMNLIAYADGESDLIEIANIIGVSATQLIPTAQKLMYGELLEVVGINS